MKSVLVARTPATTNIETVDAHHIPLEEDDELVREMKGFPV